MNFRFIYASLCLALLSAPLVMSADILDSLFAIRMLQAVGAKDYETIQRIASLADHVPENVTSAVKTSLQNDLVRACVSNDLETIKRILSIPFVDVCTEEDLIIHLSQKFPVLFAELSNRQSINSSLTLDPASIYSSLLLAAISNTHFDVITALLSHQDNPTYDESEKTPLNSSENPQIVHMQIDNHKFKKEQKV